MRSHERYCGIAAGKAALGAFAIGAAALGAVAVGAAAVGCLTIGVLQIKRLRLLDAEAKSLHIERLSVGSLDIREPHGLSVGN